MLNHYYAGMDIGGTKTLITIEDEDRKTVFWKHLPSETNPDFIQNTLDRCLLEAGLQESELLCLGVGIPGRVDLETGIILDAPSLGWVNMNIRKRLQSYNFPIYLNNDVRMALLGEKTRTDSADKQNIVFVAIGTGLGSAFLSDGQILYGRDNCAGEIGYLIYPHDVLGGSTNAAGCFGALENALSGTALARTAKGFGRTPEALFSAYGQGNTALDKAVDDFLLHLACLLANLASLMNPEQIIIGGGVSDSLSPFIDRLCRESAALTPMHCEVHLSRLGNHAGVLGAVEYGRICLNLMNYGKDATNERLSFNLGNSVAV